jgi:calcineurin-like phosphoesterase family protein
MYLKLPSDDSIKFYITSDTHFGHKNILEYSDRPFSDVNEMDEYMIDSWNSVVSPQDIVFHLGDFAFLRPNRVIEILSRLSGTIYFVYGNHDRVMRNPIVTDYSKQTKKIRYAADVFECKYKKDYLFMSHYAHRIWNRSHRGSIHFYGHSHGSIASLGRSMDVGVDSKDMDSNYAPFLLDDVIEFTKLKPVHKVDHH